ncbi:phosphonate C-P lyase system protein PhnG [Methylobacterium sp. Leaf465]|uniref:phosphonate C-P lyase system protein PhnG n=1 Tax=Methylobacterium sp. Leaf465 TaxID=1736385 RepID=UPI002413D9FB|nr:phosphonate C-P lyase system protein PhnG [Methylobacterium sp. Leaf465]
MPDLAPRQRAMARAGQASADELLAALARAGAAPEAEDLRAPETGLVMVRGRIGGDGRPFNAGEATVTRAAVRLPGGETGFAYHLGRDRARARLAAILDAHWQRPEARPALEAALAEIAGRRVEAAQRAARKAAATRVTFFTLARGED